MADSHQHKNPSRGLIWFYTALIGLTLSAGLVGVYGIYEGQPWGAPILIAGATGLFVAAAAAPLAIGFSRRSETKSPREIDALLREIRDHLMLSDQAKRLLFRENELQLLRSAIEQHIQAGDADAALVLCEEMASSFGHREEAEQFRSRVNEARQEQYEHQVDQALATFEQLLQRHNWRTAYEEAARIRRLYPDSHRIGDLDQQIMRAREHHKARLEQEFLDAAGREDAEEAMKLLKQLDRYLDRQEAAGLSELAQGVITRHRSNLGLQFKIAVRDHRWSEAARIGEEVIEEFPNTRMADEVRSMLNIIRTRASQTAMSGGQQS